MNSIQRRRERQRQQKETTVIAEVKTPLPPQQPKKVTFDDDVKETVYVDSPRIELVSKEKENKIIIDDEKMSETKSVPPPLPTSPPPQVPQTTSSTNTVDDKYEDDGSASLDIDGKELLKIIGQELKVKAAAGKENIGEDIFIALLPAMMEFIETRKLPGPQKKRVIINVVNVAISKSPFIPNEKRAQMLAWSGITLSGMIDLAVSASKGQLNVNAMVKTGFSLMVCCK